MVIMKKSIHKFQIVILSLLLLLSGCGEMLDNPLKDKETGEDINLLIVDFNIFETRTTYKLIDVVNSEEVKLNARIWFTGSNANDIVNFAGEKDTEYFTSLGQLELTFDPYIEFSESSPIDYTVHVEVEGYQEFSQNIQINTEGIKTFELFLSPISGGDEEVLTGNEDPEDGGTFIFSAFVVKSANVDKGYKVNYSITKTDLINFTDVGGQTLFGSLEELQTAYQNNPDNFLQLTIDIKTGFPATTEKVYQNGEPKIALFKKLEIGNLISLTVNGRTVNNLNGGKITQTCSLTGTAHPDLFGFANIASDIWTISNDPVVHYDLDLSYIFASASVDEICGIGSTLNFFSSSKTSFSIDADIFDADEQKIKTTGFSGTFPKSITLENVPNTAATIVFRDNNPAFNPIAPLEIDNLCSGSYDVEVVVADKYNEYVVVLKVYCEDNPSIALAPTYSGEMRIKNSNQPWQGIEMAGGIAEIMAKENEEYQIRLLFNDGWEYVDFITEFDAEGNYINEFDSEISSYRMNDGRIKIFIEHTFEQDVCNDLGW